MQSRFSWTWCLGRLHIIMFSLDEIQSPIAFKCCQFGGGTCHPREACNACKSTLWCRDGLKNQPGTYRIISSDNSHFEILLGILLLSHFSLPREDWFILFFCNSLDNLLFASWRKVQSWFNVFVINDCIGLVTLWPVFYIHYHSKCSPRLCLFGQKYS